jgi:hypothetical protein
MKRWLIRNEIWYFWLRFLATVAMRRIPLYAVAMLPACWPAARAWLGGNADAWRDRDVVRGHREPIPRGLLRTVGMRRGRMQLRFMAWMGLRRALRPLNSLLRRTPRAA